MHKALSRSDLNREYRDKWEDAIMSDLAGMTVDTGTYNDSCPHSLNSTLRCQQPLSRRPEEHANRGYRAKETRLSLCRRLCQKNSARLSHSRRQYVRQRFR